MCATALEAFKAPERVSENGEAMRCDAMRTNTRYVLRARHFPQTSPCSVLPHRTGRSTARLMACDWISMHVILQPRPALIREETYLSLSISLSLSIFQSLLFCLSFSSLSPLTSTHPSLHPTIHPQRHSWPITTLCP